MEESNYEIIDEQDHYKVKATLITQSRDGKENDRMGEALIKYGVLRDDDEGFRYEIVKEGNDPLRVFAVFQVDKTELKYTFTDVKDDMDEIAERAQEKYWEALEFAEKVIQMLKVAKELNLMPS